MKKLPVIDEGMKRLLVQSASNDITVARVAQRELAIALQVPLRQGILDGPIWGNIWTPYQFDNNQSIEFPLDFIVPGTEEDYGAFTIPNMGRIPEKHVQGDYLTVPVYDVGAAIDWSLKYARDARWDVVGRAMAVLENMFIRKINSDSWKVIIAAAVDRNLLVLDSNAPQGFFTKRLVSLMKTSMRRSGGGNLASLNQLRLTDLYMSPENMEDIRSWDLTQIDETTRREIQVADGDFWEGRIYGVNLHVLDELGENQDFQTFYTSLGGSLGSDLELVIGLCQNDVVGSCFVHPIRQTLELFEDDQLHRQRRHGYYGWQEHGFGLLDNRYVMFGSN